MKKSDISQDIVIAGIEARLPGLRYARTQIDDEIKKYEALIRGSRGDREDLIERGSNGAGPAIFREDPIPKKPSNVKKYWAKMTPEQRAAEMQRRGLTGRPKKKGQSARTDGFIGIGEAVKRSGASHSAIYKAAKDGRLRSRKEKGPTGDIYVVDPKALATFPFQLRRKADGIAAEV